ncbi:MAG: hypothetical protein AAGI68_03255 [Planctomycetota bacterium]
MPSPNGAQQRDRLPAVLLLGSFVMLLLSIAAHAKPADAGTEKPERITGIKDVLRAIPEQDRRVFETEPPDGKKLYELDRQLTRQLRDVPVEFEGRIASRMLRRGQGRFTHSFIGERVVLSRKPRIVWTWQYEVETTEEHALRRWKPGRKIPVQGPLEQVRIRYLLSEDGRETRDAKDREHEIVISLMVKAQPAND